MCLQRFHYGLQQGAVQIRRIRELLLAVAGRLLHQDLVLQKLAFEHTVHVHELIVVAQLAFQRTIRLLNDFGQVVATQQLGGRLYEE